jgi:hypothetical protein
MQGIIQGGAGSLGFQGKKEVLCRACRLGENFQLRVLLSFFSDRLFMFS